MFDVIVSAVEAPWCPRDCRFTMQPATPLGQARLALVTAGERLGDLLHLTGEAAVALALEVIGEDAVALVHT